MDLNFADLFTLDVPLLEIFVRGSIMYLGVFTILRLILQREVGSVGIPDLLMITLIADAAQNGMAGKYESITVGLLLVLTLVFWNFLLDWCSFHFPWFEHLTHSKPLRLIHNGKLQLRNMRNANMSCSELKALLREEGVETVDKVKTAYLEGNGKLSVIER